MGWRTIAAGSRELTGILNDLLDRADRVERFHDLPTGTVIDFAGVKLPPGFLVADGSAVSRVDYAGLFVTLGTSWGSGDGSTTFNLPDLRAAFTVGAGTNSLIAGSVAKLLGAHGGEEAHKLLSTESGEAGHNHGGNTFDDTPDHAHNYTSGDYSAGFQVPAGAFYGLTTPASSTTIGANARHHHPIPSQAAADAALAHNNLPPYAVVQKIIRI